MLLYLFVVVGYVDCCKYFLVYGVDVISVGYVGVILLYFVVVYSYLDVIKVLVENEGDFEVRNQYGFNIIFGVLYLFFIRDFVFKVVIIIWIF